MHLFHKSKIIGEEGETLFTEFFRSHGYEVLPLSIPDQKQNGYDFDVIKGCRSFCAEVKYDRRAQETGNLFFETKVENKVGWCLRYPVTSPVKVFWVFPDHYLMMRANRLSSIPYRDYPSRKIFGTLNGEGYLIPLQDMPAQRIPFNLSTPEIDALCLN